MLLTIKMGVYVLVCVRARARLCVCVHYLGNIDRLENVYLRVYIPAIPYFGTYTLLYCCARGQGCQIAALTAAHSRTGTRSRHCRSRKINTHGILLKNALMKQKARYTP